MSLGPRSPQPRDWPTHLLATWFDLLAILEPLEGKVRVADLHHQLDLVAPVHLVGWVQLLREGWRWRDTGGWSSDVLPAVVIPQAAKSPSPDPGLSKVKVKKPCMALAGVAQWIECKPVNQRVAGSIPSQGTCLGFGPGPQ